MRTLHLISHTHWDREWHQTFQQFRLRLVHLIDGLLDILDTDSQFQHFMLDGQTIVLEDYLQIRPEREMDLRKYVQNGRLLIGPWYILPDEFLVSPEAIIRNLLEGARVAKLFGPKMMVGYIPDPFGHIGQMPQILRGFGLQTACLWRGVGDQPNEFWWQSPDGSQVLMGFLRHGYGNAAGILGSSLDGFVATARTQRDLLAAHTRGEELILMHGVDHQEAHPGTSAAVAYAAGKLDGDVLVHSTLPEYFARVQKTMDLKWLPVVVGELRSPKHAPILPGVLSARMWIKQRNRACEVLLEKWAEPFSVWAQLYATHQRPPDMVSHPEAVLLQAWRLLLQCHPHDSICGCSIDQVHDEMRPRFDQVEQMGEEITRQSLVALAGAVASHPPAQSASGQISLAVVVFNPTAGPRSDSVSVAIEGLPESGAFDLVDESGVAIPFQTLGMSSAELVNLSLDRKEFQNAFNMVGPATDIGGGKILEIQVQRGGSQVSIEVQVGQTGEPDLVGWERTREEIQALLKDPEITTYNVQLRPVASGRLLFTARDVPGMGYRTFWLRSKESAKKEPVRLSAAARALMPVAARLATNPVIQKLIQRMAPDPASKPPYTIENEFFVVEAQPDGYLDIRDKRTGVLYRGQNRFVDGGDRGDTYNYSPPETDRIAPVRLKRVRVERGSVQQTLEIVLEMETPEALETDRKTRSRNTVVVPLTNRVTLSAGVARVDIHTEVDNQARDHRLRVHFAAPFAAQEADYDGHFEVVRRRVGIPAFDASWAEQPRPEVPQRSFTAVFNEISGLLIANRGLTEVEVLRRGDGNAEIAMTLLRCVGWLSRDDFPERKGLAGPAKPTPGAQMLGRWAFDYAIVPFHAADRSQAYEQAHAFEAPLRAVSTPLHEGILPAQGSYVQVEPTEFVISTIKTAADQRGWLVRGYNMSHQPITVTLKTFGPMSTVERVTFAEEPLEPLIPIADHAVTLDVKGHEVVTVLFSVNRTPAAAQASAETA